MSGPFVLGIAGSPRRHGNSERLLDAFLQGAADEGATVEKAVASGIAAQPCTACGSCSATGVCVFEDGVSDLMRRIDSAAGLVIASPVYFAGVPGTLKVVLDRMQPYWARRYRLGDPARPKRPGGFILVRAGGDPFPATGAEDTLRSVLAVMGFSVSVEERFEGLDAAGDVEQEPGLLERVRERGRAFALGLVRAAADGE